MQLKLVGVTSGSLCTLVYDNVKILSLYPRQNKVKTLFHYAFCFLLFLVVHVRHNSSQHGHSDWFFDSFINALKTVFSLGQDNNKIKS